MLWQSGNKGKTMDETHCTADWSLSGEKSAEQRETNRRSSVDRSSPRQSAFVRKVWLTRISRAGRACKTRNKAERVVTMGFDAEPRRAGALTVRRARGTCSRTNRRCMSGRGAQHAVARRTGMGAACAHCILDSSLSRKNIIRNHSAMGIGTPVSNRAARGDGPCSCLSVHSRESARKRVDTREGRQPVAAERALLRTHSKMRA